jgi:cytochrome c oxidase subunit IV
MSQHVVSPRSYLAVFGALLVLTATTVLVATVELGPWHIVVALLIASLKAVLVVLFFMHVLHSPRLVWLALGLALFCFGILFVQTFSDYLSRDWMRGTSPARQLKVSDQSPP